VIQRNENLGILCNQYYKTDSYKSLDKGQAFILEYVGLLIDEANYQIEQKEKDNIELKKVSEKNGEIALSLLNLIEKSWGDVKRELINIEKKFHIT